MSLPARWSVSACAPFRRWTEAGGVKADGRPDALRPPPAHRLSDEERAEVRKVCNEALFASLPPSQMVPTLADEGRYLASESTFYRVLHGAHQQHHRGRADAPNRRAPSSHEATGPNQLWCWDITYLPSGIRGLYFYLYLVLDVFSRKIVGWEVYGTESGEQAAALLQRTLLNESIQTWRKPLSLHSDNGAPIKSATLLATLQWLNRTNYFLHLCERCAKGLPIVCSTRCGWRLQRAKYRSLSASSAWMSSRSWLCVTLSRQSFQSRSIGMHSGA